MPYIDRENRESLVHVSCEIGSTGVKNAGELQFLIAELVDEYLCGKDDENGYVCYQDMNDVMGALSGAQQEFYRIVVAPYEDKKIEQNGGVYSAYRERGY